METCRSRLHRLRHRYDVDEAHRLRQCVWQSKRRYPESEDWEAMLEELTYLKQLHEGRQRALNSYIPRTLSDLRNRLSRGEDIREEADELARVIISDLRSNPCQREVQLAESRVLHFRASNPNRLAWREVESAFECRIVSGVIGNTGYTDPEEFLAAAANVIPRDYFERRAVKINAGLECIFIKEKTGEEVRLCIWARTFTLFPGDDPDAILQRYLIDRILYELDIFEEGQSGMTLDEMLFLKVNINKYDFARCRGSQTYTPLPPWLSETKGVLNIKNHDNKCFLWCVLAHFYPATTHPERVGNYSKYQEKLIFQEDQFPITKHGIRKFERENDLRIFIFAEDYEEYKLIYPWYTSRRTTGDIVDLFILPTGEEGVFHFALIKNLEAVLHATRHPSRCRGELCRNCFQYIDSRNVEDHWKRCFEKKPCVIEMPKDKCMKFRHYIYSERLPCVVYGDFESMQVPQDDKTVKHVPIAAGLYVHFDDRIQLESEYFKWSETDCVSSFLDQLLLIANFYADEYERAKVPMKPLTPQQEICHFKATECWICRRPFSGYNFIRVMDHCHRTGEYRGPAHKGCNINLRERLTIPVFFHNLSGYDGHLIVRELAIHQSKYGRLDILPRTKEKYISFSFSTPRNVRLRFVDSYQFMASSLDKLGRNLQPLQKKILRSRFPRDEDFDLINQKGVFPYEWLSSEEQLDEESLPLKNDFYSKLIDEDISDQDYQRAHRVWNHFEMKTIRDYLMLYLKIDVLLLADIFEAFRETCLNVYGLDPAHYLTAPGLALDAALKLTHIELELLKDTNMIQFVEAGIRGGVSQCSGRYARANIPGREDYDVNSPPSTIAYLDANNLYGWAMSQPLPYADFTWMPEEEWEQIGTEGEEIGYFLEVDLHYPESLQPHHSDLPLAPEHRVPPGSKMGHKLMCTLYDKERYVLHHKILELYLQLGLVVTKIHRVLRFRQKAWLAEYIQKNTTMRQAATNDFEKDFFKLMNNSVFGKTIENVRKRKRVSIAKRWEGRYGAGALIASPQFHSQEVIDDETVIIELFNSKVIMDKPIYVGAAILDWSKLLMYQFHYNYVKRVMPATQLLYTDTDSLMYHLIGNTLDDLIARNPDQFDTSSYPPTHPLYSTQNKAVIGKMKDEVSGQKITRFVGLRSKMYTYEVEGDLVKKRAKGIRGSVVKKITLDQYLKCLDGSQGDKIEQYIFTSKGHVIFTKLVKKQGLSGKDDKRYVLPQEPTRTLPWGHKSIPTLQEEYTLS